MPSTDEPVDIKPPALETIHAHAIETYPHECCGALLGRSDDASIITALRLPNTTEELSLIHI